MTGVNRLKGDIPLTDPSKAADFVENDDTVAVSGFGSVGNPKVVPATLATSAHEGRPLDLSIISGGSTGEHIDTQLFEADAVGRRYPYQGQETSRRAINQREVAFHDSHISRLGEQVELGSFVDIDTAVVEAIAVKPGKLIPSTSIGHTPSYVAAADQVIIEVNESQPIELAELHDVFRPGLPPNRGPIPLSTPGDRIGDPWIEFNQEKLVAVVKSNEPDTPYTFRDPTEVDLKIAANFASFLEDEINRNPAFEDSIRLQFGVGSLGNALMSAIDKLNIGDRTLDYYGEVIQDGMLDLLEKGTFDDASATSLALSKDGQERLFRNIDRYEDEIILRPADISNRAEIIDRFGVIAVNSGVEVDIFGNVNSTHVNGTRLINGIGGSGDFNRNSLLSITAIPSAVSNGDISKIRPAVTHVDHPEHDVDIIITEKGVADMRALSPVERAEAVIDNCAGSGFRDQLYDYLNQAMEHSGHIPHDLDVAFDPIKDNN